METGASRSPRSFGLYEAKNRLSELIDRVAAGEEVVITRHGRPVARLVPERPDAVDATAVDAIFDELRELSGCFAPDVTLEELRGYIGEGRR